MLSHSFWVVHKNLDCIVPTQLPVRFSIKCLKQNWLEVTLGPLKLILSKTLPEPEPCHPVACDCLSQMVQKSSLEATYPPSHWLKDATIWMGWGCCWDPLRFLPVTEGAEQCHMGPARALVQEKECGNLPSLSCCSSAIFLSGVISWLKWCYPFVPRTTGEWDVLFPVISLKSSRWPYVWVLLMLASIRQWGFHDFSMGNSCFKKNFLCLVSSKYLWEITLR